jgi:cell division septation protein DedD
MCCLSEPGYHEFVEALTQKHGTIARLWTGPYLTVVLAETKYVEVSKLTLAL